MAIDYSIPSKFGQLRIEPPNLSSQYSTLAALSKMNAEQQELKATQEKQARISELLPKVIDPTQPNGINQANLEQLLVLDPDAGSKVRNLRDLAMPQFAAGNLSPTKIPDYVDENGGYGSLLVYPGGKREFIPQQKPVEKPKTDFIEKDGYKIYREWDAETGKMKEVGRSPISQPKEVKDKPPTDAQQRYSFFASRGESALTELETLFAKGYRPSSNAIKYLAMNPSDYAAQGLRKTLTPQDQQFVATVPKALTAILRPESGAVIGPDEIGSYLQAYIPMAGEGVEKFGGLKKELENLRALSRGGLAGDITAPGAKVNNKPVNPKAPNRHKAGVKF